MTSVTPPRDRPRWWIAAITFVTGVVVGIVMVGLLSLSKPDFLSAVESTAPGSAQMPSGAGTVPDRGPGSGQRSLSERDQQSARYLFDSRHHYQRDPDRNPTSPLPTLATPTR
jgi:hypothetical protein